MMIKLKNAIIAGVFLASSFLGVKTFAMKPASDAFKIPKFSANLHGDMFKFEVPDKFNAEETERRQFYGFDYYGEYGNDGSGEKGTLVFLVPENHQYIHKIEKIENKNNDLKIDEIIDENKALKTEKEIIDEVNKSNFYLNGNGDYLNLRLDHYEKDNYEIKNKKEDPDLKEKPIENENISKPKVFDSIGEIFSLPRYENNEDTLPKHKDNLLQHKKGIWFYVGAVDTPLNKFRISSYNSRSSNPNTYDLGLYVGNEVLEQPFSGFPSEYKGEFLGSFKNYRFDDSNGNRNDKVVLENKIKEYQEKHKDNNKFEDKIKDDKKVFNVDFEEEIKINQDKKIDDDRDNFSKDIGKINNEDEINKINNEDEINKINNEDEINKINNEDDNFFTLKDVILNEYLTGNAQRERQRNVIDEVFGFFGRQFGGVK